MTRSPVIWRSKEKRGPAEPEIQGNKAIIIFQLRVI
jgi:hypothetical protein